MAFGEPRLDADLASIVSPPPKRAKPGRMITPRRQGQAIRGAAFLVIAALGLAQYMADGTADDTARRAAFIAIPPHDPLPRLAKIEQPILDESPALAPAPPKIRAKPAPAPTRHVVKREKASMAVPPQDKPTPPTQSARPRLPDTSATTQPRFAGPRNTVRFSSGASGMGQADSVLVRRGRANDRNDISQRPRGPRHIRMGR